MVVARMAVCMRIHSSSLYASTRCRQQYHCSAANDSSLYMFPQAVISGVNAAQVKHRMQLNRGR